MIDWKRLFKAFSIVVVAAAIFYILVTILEWLANNHPIFLMVSVITFFVLFVTAMIYFLLDALED